MLDPNIHIIEHEQEWTCPSTGITYYRTIEIERTIDPDYGADADGRRGERAAFYEVDTVGPWYGSKPSTPPIGEDLVEALNLNEDDEVDYHDNVRTPDEICDRIAETDEW